MILRLFSLLSVPLALFMFYKLANSIRREQVYNRKALVNSMMMAGMMMLVNMIFMLSAFFSWPMTVWLVALAIGFVFGMLWGSTSKLFLKDDRVVMKRSAMHLVFWAGAYALTHLLTAIFPANIAAMGLAAMFFSTGSTIGMNANLLNKRKKVLQPGAPTTA